MAQEAGIKDSALGCDKTGGRVPEWLEKWAALTCAFVAEERRLLPLQLATLPPPNYYPPAEAEIQARGALCLTTLPPLGMATVASVHIRCRSAQMIDMVIYRGRKPIESQRYWTRTNLLFLYYGCSTLALDSNLFQIVQLIDATQCRPCQVLRNGNMSSYLAFCAQMALFVICKANP